MFEQCQKQIDYDDYLVSLILFALNKVDFSGDMSNGQNSEIVRIFTFKSMCMLLIYLSLNKKIEPCSLQPHHLQQLLQCYEVSIANLKMVMNTNMAEIVPEVIEEEFNKFKTNLMMDT